MENPDSLADYLDPGGDVECEAIWYIAQEAYAEKTGKDDFMEKSGVEIAALEGDLSEWNGEDGQDDSAKLKALFPRLFTKFWAD